MALSTSDYIRLKCPKLYADANLADWIAMGTERAAACYYGAKHSLAVALWASHMYTMANNALRQFGEGGSITHKSEGDISIQFESSTSKFADPDLPQTVYGRELLGLRVSSGPAISVTGLKSIRNC